MKDNVIKLNTPDYTISGVVKRIRFAAPDGGFQILQIVQPDGEEATLVGPLRGASVGSTIEAEGRWETNARFGRQFRVARTRWTPPTTVEGLVAALQGLVDGIGEGYARRIVEGLGGADSARLWLDGLGGDPHIPRVSTADLDRLRTAWGAQRADRELETHLASLGIAPAARSKIAQRYGARALSVVKDRPYDLALEVDGIGFATADAIAQAVGVAPSSVERATAALRHALHDEAQQRGHVWAPRTEAVRLVERLCGPTFSSDTIDGAIEALVRRDAIEVSPAGNLALKMHAEAERTIAARAARGLDHRTDGTTVDAIAAIDPRLTDEQRASVIAALGRRFTVITGGPGVGKTTTTKAIADAWREAGVPFALCAPTGRAAKRLKEATGQDASTIHRLLGYDPVKKGFLHDETCKLPISAILCDEGSMIDCALMKSLFSALHNDVQIVLVGDADQLPPVGPGAPFRDLCEGLPDGAVHRLTQVFRQAQGSRIVMGSRQILAGQAPTPSPSGSTDDGTLYRIVEPDVDALADLVVHLVADVIPERFGFMSREIQVITPQHKGTVGTALLNAALRDRLNPRGERETLTIGEGPAARSFRVGDRVRQTKNDYEKNVVNGDLGIVESVVPQGRSRGLCVRFDDELVRYTASETHVLDLAYAFSVHASQGGEFPAVVVVLHDCHGIMLERALVYTAVTRARRTCTIVGTDRALVRACKTARADARRTTLPRALLQALETNGGP